MNAEQLAREAFDLWRRLQVEHRAAEFSFRRACISVIRGETDASVAASRLDLDRHTRLDYAIDRAERRFQRRARKALVCA